MLGLLWLFAHIPYRARLKFGRGLGHIYYMFAGQDRRIATINLALCFPELSTKARQQLCRESFLNLVTAALESAFMRVSNKTPLDKMLVSIDGFEHIQALQQQGRGVIVLFPHLTAIFFAGYLCWRALGVHFGFMYRRSRNPVLARQFAKQFVGESQAFTRRNARKMLDFLRKGGIVWYAPDLLPRRQDSVHAPFFGVPAATGIAPMRFAELSGAAVVVVGFKRDKEGRFRIYFHPPLVHFPSGDLVADASRVNAAIAEQIVAYPEAYLWLYKRFDRPPPGADSPYTNRP